MIDDLIDVLRLHVRIYHNARVCGDWQMSTGASAKTCFHMPTQGNCRLDVPGHGQWTLDEGDVVLFPEELPHSLLPVERLQGPEEHLPLSCSQDKPGTSLLCGEIRFSHPGAAQLLALMPPVLVLRRAQAADWLNPLTALIVQESLRGDADNQSPVLNQLCELLVCYMLRSFTDDHSLQQGLFSLLSDKRLAPALKAIHQQPEKDWQLQDLAALVAMSRTLFSKRFREVSGWTAMQYLTWWRMQLAYGALQQGRFVAEVAADAGYGSEAAFSRAFKASFGETPGKVRAAAKSLTP
ncbi:AraC family transcriptional regulator [Granulosicoccaceae sp. 1_MG-2023]|nr:AraC family transcriptional regulator [Granulosicoccaceae sp. 1_MG-2023]